MDPQKKLAEIKEALWWLDNWHDATNDELKSALQQIIELLTLIIEKDTK